jgi:hypothetical protein
VIPKPGVQEALVDFLKEAVSLPLLVWPFENELRLDWLLIASKALYQQDPHMIRLKSKFSKLGDFLC